jgi:cell wall assembly regulator SMI1
MTSAPKIPLKIEGLPKINLLMGGRYVPAVLKFFERLDGSPDQPQPTPRQPTKEEMEAEAEAWNRRKPRSRPAPARAERQIVDTDDKQE